MTKIKVFCLLIALFANSLCTIVMTKDEWVEKLEVLASRKTKYSQQYGYNALRYDGDVWWCDCSNLMKALFNGRDIYDFEVNKFERSTANTGDVNANGLILKCGLLSTDFKELKAGEPRLIHMDGHIGAYIGKEVNTDHGVCNVIECTGAWGGGIRYSYVDKRGRRTYGKNGAQVKTWQKHGVPNKWVSY